MGAVREPRSLHASRALPSCAWRRCVQSEIQHRLSRRRELHLFSFLGKRKKIGLPSWLHRRTPLWLWTKPWQKRKRKKVDHGDLDDRSKKRIYSGCRSIDRRATIRSSTRSKLTNPSWSSHNIDPWRWSNESSIILFLFFYQFLSANCRSDWRSLPSSLSNQGIPYRPIHYLFLDHYLLNQGISFQPILDHYLLNQGVSFQPILDHLLDHAIDWIKGFRFDRSLITSLIMLWI